MKTWDETRADILNHLETELPMPEFDQILEALKHGKIGSTLMDCFTAYVRRIEVSKEYEKLAETPKT